MDDNGERWSIFRMDLTRLNSALSSVHHAWEFHDPSSIPPTVLAALQAALPEIVPGSWPERLAIGGVYLNGRRVLEDRPLVTPSKLEYYAPKFEPAEAESFFPAFDPQRIVYEDDQLLAYYKPPGLPTLPVKEQQLYNLRLYIDRYLGHPAHLPSRLDTSASGIVLVSKDPEYHHKVQLLFERRRAQKLYLIDVGSIPEWAWTIVNRAVGRDPRHTVLRRLVDLGGKPAITLFSKAGDRFSPTTIVVEPKTGRTHQIRVHIASLGLPIVGDNFYAGPEGEDLRLLAFSLEFEHPATKRGVKIELPEKDWPGWLLTR